MSFTASLRAPEGYHLPDAMNLCQEEVSGLFNKFGGHPCAAGFSIEPQNLFKAKELLSKHLSQQGLSINQKSDSQTKVNIPEKLIQYSAKKEVVWITEKEIDLELLGQIDSLDPFGQDFPMPYLAFQVLDATLNNIQWLGNEQKHLKLKTINQIPLTFFNLKPETKDFFESKNKVENLWVFAKLNQNAWNNKRSLELVVDKVFLV
jgi:single-stranded DNA-specific DHH superfamily exonuclease